MASFSNFVAVLFDRFLTGDLSKTTTIRMIPTRLNSFLFSLSIFLLIGVSLHAQDVPEELKKGQELFMANCASCHNKNMKDPMTGPALYGAEAIWEEEGEFEELSGREWLYKWIKNSQAVIGEGHPRANQLWGEWGPSLMTPMALNNEEIDQILDYVEWKATAEPVVVVVPPGVGDQPSPYLKYFLYVMVGLLLIIALILSRVTSVLNRLVLEKEGELIPAPVAFYKNKKLWVTIGLLIFVYVGYSTVDGAINLGRQEGYAPTQPIKFSHELHAGINQIDCQYCHTGAAKGKHSNIPSASTCMNCHKGIKEAKVNGKYGRKEIAKIYASIGFNPNGAGSYFENYEDLPRDSIAAVFTEWLAGDAEPADEEAVEAVLNQIQKPIEWVRIHNLPDHVYFNHSQHVVAGGQECQTCHGPVETMEVLAQHAPLSMGWCVNCHRETPVDGTNEYYEIYDKYKEEHLDGGVLKVENIGGLECQKCHY